MSASPGLRRALKLAIALGLTGYVLWQSDPSQVVGSASGADWRWLAAAVALVVVDRVLMAWRWMALLDDGIAPLPARSRLLRIFFVSSFLGTFIPISLGGDAVRAWRLKRENVDAARAFASVLMDRLLGVVALLALASAGLWAVHALLPTRVLTLAFAAAAGGSAAAIALIYSASVEGLLHRLATILPVRIAGKLSQLLRALRAYSTRHRTVTLVLALSVLVNALRILQTIVIGEALGIDAPIAAYVAFTPIIMLLMQLPISVYGLGTTQVGFWWLFARVGVAEADAFALSILFMGLGILGTLPGGLLYAFDPGSRPPRHEPV